MACGAMRPRVCGSHAHCAILLRIHRAMRRRRLLLNAARGDKAALMSLGSFLFLMSESAVSLDDVDDVLDISDDEGGDNEFGTADTDAAATPSRQASEADTGSVDGASTASVGTGGPGTPKSPMSRGAGSSTTPKAWGSRRRLVRATSSRMEVVDEHDDGVVEPHPVDAVLSRESAARAAVERWYDGDVAKRGTSAEAERKRLRTAKRLARFVQVSYVSLKALCETPSC